MDVSLKQLRYAVALAETAHFGRAAGRAHVSQPALSQQIQAIEAQCGTLLFDRTGKSVQPTPFGTEFVERAKRILREVDDLSAFASGQTGLPLAPVRFGMIPTVAPYLLPDIFPVLLHRFPEVRFEASENRTDPLLAALESGKLDLALIASEPAGVGTRLSVSRLFDDPFVLAMDRSETAGTIVDLQTVPSERVLLLDEGHCLRDQAIAACGLRGERTPRTFAATSLSTIVALVAQGQGVTLLPRLAVPRETSANTIAISPLSQNAGRQLLLVWPQSTPFASLFEAMAQTIRDVHANQA